MKSPRTAFLVGVLVLVNILVFGSLLILLFNAVTGGSSSPPPATSTPRALATPTLVPPPATSTPPGTTAATRPAGAPTAASPAAAATASPCTSGTADQTYPCTYTVRAGDSISVIAKRFNLTAAKIMAANNISNADFIKVGQVLIIPDPNK